jgi:hypothetical protein
MKQLQKSDLKDGEIYIAKHVTRITSNNKYIVKITNNMKECINIYDNNTYLYRNGNFSDIPFNFYEATPEEKHWLEECIKADTYISYEEAMKTFVPEFTLPEKWRMLVSEDYLDILLEWRKTLNLKYMSRIEDIRLYRYITDEGYGSKVDNFYPVITIDQFKKYVLKEESVTIKTTVETKSKFIDNNTVETSEGSIFKVGDLVTIYNNNNKTVFKILSFRWKNDQSEICAVVPNLPNGIGVDKLEIYIEPKVKENLTLPRNLCVEVPLIKEESLLDKAKRLYPIGTKYRTAGYYNHIYTVSNQSFSEYTNDIIYGELSKGCLFYKNHWAEVVEYPHGFKVGDKIKLSRWQHSSFMKDIEYTIVKIEGNQLFLNDNNSVLAKNAIKIDDFVLPEKWCVKVTNKNVDFINKVRDRRCYNTYMTSRLILTDIKNSWWCCLNAPFQGYTEITFGQFKKYVLNETV